MSASPNEHQSAARPWWSSAESVTLFALMALAVGTAIYSLESLKFEPRIFPLSISVAIVLCSLIRLAQIVHSSRSPAARENAETMEITIDPAGPPHVEAGALIAVASIVPLMFVFGLTLATFIYTTVFVRIYGPKSWLWSAIIGAITTFFIWWASIYFLRASSPRGIVIDWIAAWLH